MSDLSHYPKTDKFEIIDTIGTPHPFCITPRHVVFASDHHGGMLGKEAIEAYEKSKGSCHCGVKGCQLSFAEHETALLIAVDDSRELGAIPELPTYLLKCKPICEKDGYAGFAFMKKKS
jgi:hypothetical protein